MSNQQQCSYEYFRDFYLNFPFCQALGFKYISGGEKQPQVLGVPWQNKFRSNYESDSVHTTVLTTLVDTTGAIAAVAQMSPEFKAVVTVNLRIDFFSEIQGESLILAKAKCMPSKKIFILLKLNVIKMKTSY